MKWSGTVLAALTVLGQTPASAEQNDAPQWIRQFGTSGHDHSNAMTLDGNGNLYVTGYTGGTFSGQKSSGGADAYLAKYDRHGQQQWVRQFGSSGNDYGFALATDGSGNLYVSGMTSGTFAGAESSGSTDVYIAKFDAEGALQWTRQFGTADRDYGLDITADAEGNLYVTGYTYATFDDNQGFGERDAYLAKYDSKGVCQWVYQFGSAGADYGASVAVDAKGDVYVAGHTSGNLSSQGTGGMDAYVAKFRSKGILQWIRQSGTKGNDYGISVAVAEQGTVYVGGYTTGVFPGEKGQGGGDTYVTQYTTDGQQKWTRQFGTASKDIGRDMAVDRKGDLYISGYTDGTFAGAKNYGASDAYIVKYGSDGTRQWVRQYGTASADSSLAIAADPAGNLYVGGETSGAFEDTVSQGSLDAYVVRYAAETTEHLATAVNGGY